MISKVINRPYSMPIVEPRRTHCKTNISLRLLTVDKKYCLKVLHPAIKKCQSVITLNLISVAKKFSLFSFFVILVQTLICVFTPAG